MCIFQELFAVEVIWGVFQDCWHLWPFPSGNSADVLHCSAVQVTLYSLYSYGSTFKKIAKNGVPVHTGLNPSHFTNETAFVSHCILHCSNLSQFLCVRELTLFKCYHWRSSGILCFGFCCPSWCELLCHTNELLSHLKRKISKEAVTFFNFLLDVGLAHLLCVRTHNEFLCWMAVSVGFCHVLSQKGIEDTLRLEPCRSLNRSRYKCLSWVRGGNNNTFWISCSWVFKWH